MEVRIRAVVAYAWSCHILMVRTVPQGYQTAAPQAQSQWAPPVQNQAPTQQWNQPQQAAGGYNPATYGTMPGGYSQGQQVCHSRPGWMTSETVTKGADRLL